MVNPTLQVEFGFQKSGNDYVWNDISSYVRSVDIGRGVNREIDVYSAGSANITLSNANRYFDPSYDDSTTRTNLVKNPIPSTSAAVSPQESWSVINRGTGGAGTTTLTANGAFDTVTTAASSIGYSFGVTGSTNAARIQVTAGLTYTVSFYATSSVSDTRRTGATFYNSAGTSLGENSGDITVMQAGIETRFTGTFTAPATAVSMRIYGGQTTGSVIRPLSSTMYWRLALVEEASTAGTYFSGSTTDTNYQIYSWTGTAESSTSTLLQYATPYYNLIQPAGAVRITSNSTVIFYGFIDSWDFDYPENGFDAIATIRAFDALSVLSKINLDYTVNLAESTGGRIQRMLNKAEVSWNPALTDIEGGQNTVQGDEVSSGTSVLSYIQQVAKSEPGDIFVTRDGLVVFRDRRWLEYSWNSPTTRYNYCTNPSFGSTLTGWSGTITRSSATAHTDSYSLRADFNGVLGDYYTKYAGTIPVTSGQSVTFSAYIKNTSASATTYSITGKVGAVTASSSPSITSSTTWTRVSQTVVAGATGTLACELTLDNSSQSYYVDSVLIEISASADTYFDGTNTPTPDPAIRYLSYWTGANNLSSSYLETSTLITNPSAVTPIYLADYNAGGSDIPYIDIQVSYNSENLFNRITISRVLGSVQTREDTTAQASYGIRTYSASDYLNDTDAQVLSIAGELLTIYKSPELRAEKVTLNLTSLSTAEQNTILAADLRTAAQVKFKPSRTGSLITKQYVILGISHSLTQKDHIVTFALASLTNQPFRLNSTVTGVLDSNRLGY